MRSAGDGLATMTAPAGTAIAFATQPGNVARDGAGSHSPYTEALAKAIRTPGLDLFDTFNDVGLAVKKATGGRQQPWLSSSPIEGRFYFAGMGGQDVRPLPDNFADLARARAELERLKREADAARAAAETARAEAQAEARRQQALDEARRQQAREEARRQQAREEARAEAQAEARRQALEDERRRQAQQSFPWQVPSQGYDQPIQMPPRPQPFVLPGVR